MHPNLVATLLRFASTLTAREEDPITETLAWLLDRERVLLSAVLAVAAARCPALLALVANVENVAIATQVVVARIGGGTSRYDLVLDLASPPVRVVVEVKVHAGLTASAIPGDEPRTQVDDYLALAERAAGTNIVLTLGGDALALARTRIERRAVAPEFLVVHLDGGDASKRREAGPMAPVTATSKRSAEARPQESPAPTGGWSSGGGRSERRPQEAGEVECYFRAEMDQQVVVGGPRSARLSPRRGTPGVTPSGDCFQAAASGRGERCRGACGTTSPPDSSSWGGSAISPQQRVQRRCQRTGSQAARARAGG